jgi:diguanylate cyclase
MIETGREYGKGLNSLRVRFTVMVGVLAAVISATSLTWHHYGLQYGNAVSASLLGAVLASAILGAPLLTYVMTGHLTRPIENLKASTEAIANGNLDTEILVECNCEVGGLADSFKAMVARMNANVSRIQSLAFEDGVTGLPNRAVLENLLAQDDLDAYGAVAFIDLDRFKRINDLFGHQAGDEFLRQVAQRLLQDGLHNSLESLNRGPRGGSPSHATDAGGHMLFRFAGDEFVVLINGIQSEAELTLLGQNLIDCFREPFIVLGNRIDASCSIGIARSGTDTSSVEELCRFADMAMYESKKNGRNQVTFFDQFMKIAAQSRNQLERDLPRGLENHELRVFFQPKFDVTTKAMAGVEALVRWQHPTRGLLAPGQFLDVAASKGMMEKIGREVFRISALQIKAWEASGHHLRVAINVCPSQFLNPTFAANIIAFAKHMDVSPASFELEITETIAMSDAVGANEQAKILKAAGFKIAIDDFGVGYSNLSQLYRLRFDTLKVDRTLIANIDTDESAKRIVAFTIGMAHELGHAVVAEGIEREEQLTVLAGLGCDFAQGYLLGRPMPVEQLETLFAQGADAAPALQVA